MSARLVRALERGGMASKIERDAWGIWRARDRRCRMIGKLSGADIELLRMQKHLAPLGEEEPPILIWTGPKRDPVDATSGLRALALMKTSDEASLLEYLIAKCTDPLLRRSYRQIAEGYRLDIERVHQPERSPGMNWQALALGGRIDGGRFSSDLKISEDRAPARGRLARIKQRLSAEDLDLLDGMLLREDKRAVLAKRFATRHSLIERRALAVLRSLKEIYC